MTYSFKDDVATRLPAGYTLVRLYSNSIDESTIEASKGTLKTTFSLAKVDITPYFAKLPTLAFKPPVTLNDIYARISDIYGLGLVKNIDYYNDSAVTLTGTSRFLELPISPNSYGYKGSIRCYIIQDSFGGNSLGTYRDITQGDVSDAMIMLKLRNYLLGTLFKLDVKCFVENRLTLEFIDKIIVNINSELGKMTDIWVRPLLTNSITLDTYSDGLSNIVIIQTKDKELFQIRYLNTVIKNNDKDDNKTDNSKGLTVGDTDGSAENPVGGEGDIITGERSEHPNSITEGNTPEDVELEID